MVMTLLLVHVPVAAIPKRGNLSLAITEPFGIQLNEYDVGSKYDDDL